MYRNKDTGFTLIELMLAMVFVAFILIFISLTLVQMIRIYDKGSSMKQVNQAGRSIIDELSRAVRQQLPSAVDVSNVDAGVLCIDKTMYVWNPLYTATGPNTDPTAHTAVIGDPISGGMMARKTLVSSSDPCERDAAVTGADEAVLLSGRARVLQATASSNPSEPRLVKLTFVIGTYASSEFAATPVVNFTTPMKHDGTNFSCLPGNDGNYCAFAEFNTVVYLSKEE